VAEQQRDDLVGLGNCLLTVASQNLVLPSLVRTNISKFKNVETDSIPFLFLGASYPSIHVPFLHNELLICSFFFNTSLYSLSSRTGPCVPGHGSPNLLPRLPQLAPDLALQATGCGGALRSGVEPHDGRTHVGVRGMRTSLKLYMPFISIFYCIPTVHVCVVACYILLFSLCLLSGILPSCLLVQNFIFPFISH